MIMIVAAQARAVQEDAGAECGARLECAAGQGAGGGLCQDDPSHLSRGAPPPAGTHMHAHTHPTRLYSTVLYSTLQPALSRPPSAPCPSLVKVLSCGADADACRAQRVCLCHCAAKQGQGQGRSSRGRGPRALRARPSVSRSLYGSAPTSTRWPRHRHPPQRCHSMWRCDV